MKKFEICANFIGNLFVAVQADSAEEAKEKFILSIGALPNTLGGASTTIKNVLLNANEPIVLAELNIAFQEKLTPEDVAHWVDFEIEEL